MKAASTILPNSAVDEVSIILYRILRSRICVLSTQYSDSVMKPFFGPRVAKVRPRT